MMSARLVDSGIFFRNNDVYAFYFANHTYFNNNLIIIIIYYDINYFY